MGARVVAARAFDSAAGLGEFIDKSVGEFTSGLSTRLIEYEGYEYFKYGGYEEYNKPSKSSYCDASLDFWSYLMSHVWR